MSVAENASFDLGYAVMNVLATIVASYGLLAGNTAVVIGAMIIAVVLGPISGLGLAMVDSNSRLLWRSLIALVGGIVIVLGTAFLIGYFNRGIPASREMLLRTEPNFWDLMIALGGGAAGAYAIISPRLSAAFVGVAIATALVPPLSTGGLFLARGEFALSAGALLLTLTNIVAIQFASAVVFFASGFHKITKAAEFRWELLTERTMSVFALLILAAVMTANLNTLVAKMSYENRVHQTLQTELARYPGAYLADVRYSRGVETTIVRALVRGPAPFSAEEVAQIERNLPNPPKQLHSELWIRFVHTTVTSSRGPVYQSQDIANEPSTQFRVERQSHFGQRSAFPDQRSVHEQILN